LSLALELDCVLLTDDYSIQNIAAKLNVKSRGIAQEGIKETIKWRLRCKGCGRYWEKIHDSCPVCGSDLKTTRR
ncbi:MAG: DNA-binding protein, partial [Thermoplasmata archaeon]